MTPEPSDLLLRAFIDLACILALALLANRRRPQRGLFVVFTVFNVVLFAVLTVISLQNIGPAVGFGLFAVLSIIRLRSEPFSIQELSYFFAALGLGLINGLKLDELWLPLSLDALILVTLLLVDHPALRSRTALVRVTVGQVITDRAQLRAEVERLTGASVVEVNVLDVDEVRDLMRVMARILQPVGAAEPSGDLVEFGGERA